jgi:hypothetical protein
MFFPVVVTYSFDKETPVWLFDKESDALAEIRKQFNEELRIALDKNECPPYDNIEYEISHDGTYAVIKEYFYDHTDVTEWRLGDARDPKNCPARNN